MTPFIAGFLLAAIPGAGVLLALFFFSLAGSGRSNTDTKETDNG